MHLYCDCTYFGTGQSSRFLPQARRIVSSGDENGVKVTANNMADVGEEILLQGAEEFDFTWSDKEFDFAGIDEEFELDSGDETAI